MLASLLSSRAVAQAFTPEGYWLNCTGGSHDESPVQELRQGPTLVCRKSGHRSAGFSPAFFIPSFTPSTPRCVISGNPTPNSHRETNRPGTAVPLRESSAARPVRPSFPRKSAGKRESSFPARARPPPGLSAGRIAKLPALPSHASQAAPHTPPRLGKTRDPLRREDACPALQGPCEILLRAFGCFPCRRT